MFWQRKPSTFSQKSLIAETLAFDATKIYIKKGTRLDKIVSQDVDKSSSIAKFENTDEQKSHFPKDFRISAPNDS